MKKLILLSLLLSSQLAYSMQYGWGDNRDAVVIKDPTAVHVFMETGLGQLTRSSLFAINATDESTSIVIVDRDGNSYDFLASEVRVEQLHWGTVIHEKEGNLVFVLIDTKLIMTHTKGELTRYFNYSHDFPAASSQ